MRVRLFAVGLFSILILSCNQPSGGKKVMAREALRQIETAYADREQARIFEMDSEEAARRMNDAERAGDSSREGDARVNLEMNSCRTALSLYGVYLRTPEQSPELTKPYVDELLERCIRELKADVGQN